mmetsp:Transcript_10836/g.19794  ORF Transcript_10836/g.19794 Transcript_10836/m.19794 type:complete len:276 (-) Transcript_10836:224-1051(-)
MMDSDLPPRSETEVDEKGMKVVTEYKKNESGQTVKVTTKIQVTKEQVKVSRRVAERKKWSRFGNVKDKSDKEDMITFFGEPFNLEMKEHETNYYVEGENSMKKKLESKKSVVKCNFCGESGHWTLRCPKRKEGDGMRPAGAAGGPPGGPSTAMKSSGGKYVPMHMRMGATASRKDYDRDVHSLRITNISEDANEDDLRELFRSCGETTRVFLARDRQTQKSRGFAFVSYRYKEDAERAIQMLNGYGYDNLILHVEKAKPREPKKDDEKKDQRRKF